MSNARDESDRLHNHRKRKVSAPVFTSSEDIGRMHFSTENYTNAAEYFEEALESPDLTDFPDRFRLHLGIGDCHRRKGSYAEAQRAFSRARGLMGEEPSSEALGKVEYREAFVLLSQGDYDDALKKGYRAYRRLKASDEHNEVAYIQLLLAGCYQRLGFTGEAEDFYADALSSFRRIDDRVGIAYVYNNLGLLHKNACRWNRALASLSKSLELAKSLGLPQHMVLVNLNLGVVYAKLRRYSESLSSLTTSEEMGERLGDNYNLTKALFMKGRTFICTGEYCKAEKYILRAQAMANELNYQREAALTDEFLGELMIARGKPIEALTNLNKGLKIARMIAPEGDVVAEILRRMADVEFSLNHVEDALKLVSEGLDVAKRCGELYEIGFFYRTRGLCLRRKGDQAGALVALGQSVKTFEKYGNEYEKCRSQQLLGRLYVRRGGQESLLKSKQILSDSVVGFGAIEETCEQMLSQVLLAVVEERLGNLDDALLSLYEAERLADEEHDTKFKRLLPIMRERVERKMTRDTTRVLDQIPMFGDIHSGSRSRDALVSGLAASLKLMVEKLGAQGGFVAIPKGRGKSLEVVCRESICAQDARRMLSWYRDHQENSELDVVIVDADREEDMRVGDTLRRKLGRLVFQGMGFENEGLGTIVIHHDQEARVNPVGQEALHFLGAYARLLSLSLYELVRNERRLTPKPKPQGAGFERIVTDNHDMIKLLNLAERVAHSNATVLLQGETGTGKGLIAYAIHLLSERRDKEFVHINCAAMPEALLESELFGHSKGAFTGAHCDKKGLLSQANGGTIFLDEIGKTTLAMQGKLLQFLDSSKVRKVGSNDFEQVEVRVVCASKADLLALCQEGQFLEDFFYRINDFPLTVPPLRKRRDDIELLFFHYLRKYSVEMGKSITDVSDEAVALLRQFAWPGNVRELEKVVKRAVILADDGDTLCARHLPTEIAAPNGAGRKAGGTLRSQIERLERREIEDALRRNSWNKSRASTELGISYPSLLSKIKRYTIRTY